MTIRKFGLMILLAALVFSVGCEPTGDECEVNGWYGDGVCDDFCPQPDPDCGGDVSTTTTVTDGASTTTTTSDEADETRLFWLNDLDAGGTWQQVEASLRYQTDQVNVWVRDTDNSRMSQSLVEHYGDYFSDTSWDLVTQYVYTPTQYFGESGDRINILFYTTSEPVAGYFWSKDFYADADVQPSLRSNETNVFYMNINSAVDPIDQDYAQQFTEGTLTHEFQHMCQAHYFLDHPDQLFMDSWANETCSTTLESIFSRQTDIYVPQYNYDAENKFAAGQVRLLRWDNDFNQYILASLFGTFVVSQLDSDKQPNLIATWLEKTLSGNTSVHDLVAALEDTDVAYWTSDTPPSDDDLVQLKWSELMGDFVGGVAGNNSAYDDYIGTLTSTPIQPVTSGSGARTLEASSFVIARVNASNLSSTTGCDTGSMSAYMVAYHDGLPAYVNNTFTLPADATTCSIISTRVDGTKAVAELTLPSHRFNRSMSAYDKVNHSFSLNRSIKASPEQRIIDGGIEYLYVVR